MAQQVIGGVMCQEEDRKMAVVKDWIREAAAAIAEKWPAGVGRDAYWTPEQRANIAAALKVVIAEHCPFKPDTAYMPVPRCETCGQWGRIDEGNVGVCGYANEGENIDRKLWADLYDIVMTEHDFGCVRWEAT